MSIRRLLPLVAVCGLFAAACSSGEDTSDEASADPAASNATTITTVADEPPPETTDAPADTTTTLAETTTTEPAPDPTTTIAEVDQVPAGYEGYVSEIYADDAVWLCRPGIADNICERDLDTTLVFADGATEVVPHVDAVDPPVDCFYVYPTVSRDPEANSDFLPAEGDEIYTTINQAARLTAACRVFAPVYRQRTLTALSGAVESTDDTRELAYDDVVDAFRHYIANHSDGRPFVLTGHSQGAGLLRRLIDDEIDDEPLLRDRLVSAHLLGGSVAPDGFDNIGPCKGRSEVGCVVSYATFRDTSPPPDGTFFGRTRDGPAMCVNPVDPAGGPAVTQPYFAVASAGLLGGGVQPFDDEARTSEIATPFVSYPDMVTVECVDDGRFGYLQMTITSTDGPRTDDVGGDLTPEWGMHLIDANVAMGDLVDLVATQSLAFTG